MLQNNTLDGKCRVFEEHQFNYNPLLSSADKSVFSCVCGAEEIEHEDAGTGA